MEISPVDFNDYSIYSWEAVVGTLIFIVIAYLIGSLNMGHILSKNKKVDIGKYGSKNYGATNAGRIFGKYGFAMVFLFDFFKAILTALLLFFLSDVIGINNDVDIFINASICIALIFVAVGHSWPIYFGFKGGKGVATTYGIYTVINFVFSAIGGLVFLGVFYLVRKVYIASITSVSVVSILLLTQPFFSFYDPFTFEWSQDWTLIVMDLSLLLLIVYRHRMNLFGSAKEAQKSIDIKKVDEERKNEEELEEDEEVDDIINKIEGINKLDFSIKKSNISFVSWIPMIILD